MKHLLAVINISFITGFAVETSLIFHLHPPFVREREREKNLTWKTYYFN
jgi:hypothetical protein